jgi:hypothetical protein
MFLGILFSLLLSEQVYYSFDFLANDFKSFGQFVIDRAAPHFYGFYLTDSPFGLSEFNFTELDVGKEVLVVLANILQFYQIVVGLWSHVLVLVSSVAGYEISRRALGKNRKVRVRKI